jgi:hypothetical protein
MMTELQHAEKYGNNEQFKTSDRISSGDAYTGFEKTTVLLLTETTIFK